MLLIFIFTATPVLASNIPIVYQLMYLVSPSIAQFFIPVQKSCESNGIKMEVLSAYIHNDTVEVYITMQDFIGNRIDETTDLYDSYSINRPFDSSANCTFIDYDKETKKATFLITIKEWGNKKILGDKITFSVKEFLSDKHYYKDIPIENILANINHNPLTKQVSIIGLGSGKHEEDSFPENNATVLVPSIPINFPVNGIDLTGVGYIDDALHIQTSVINNLTKDNHGYFFLSDKEKNKILYDHSIRFVENLDSETRITYEEFVFKIPQSEIDQYSLYGTFVTSGLFTQGDWQVTFPLQEGK